MGIAVFGARKTDRIRTGIGSRLFFFVLLLLVGGAILRSAIATRLDDFTYDEAYHIAAGTSYVQRADFRLNPEHPPLVKLWVGGLMAATGFLLSAFHTFNRDRSQSRRALTAAWPRPCSAARQSLEGAPRRRML